MSTRLTPERWRQVDHLFSAALEVEPGKRASFLEKSCLGDRELRREIEALLGAEDSSPTFLDEGALALAGPALSGQDLDGPNLLGSDVGDSAQGSLNLDNPNLTDFGGPPREPAESGDRLGPYRVLKQIGAGGMSRVYLAERVDGAFEQTVAIKVMSLGGHPQAEYERRFRTERQILASFDHPQIARVFDGGLTDNGLPYLVMEYVRGQPLTTYCVENALSLEQCLELFVRVCAAVHYAHQRLVVHRDLKPSNILVTSDGGAKLLDFGIAKLLDQGAAGPDSELATTRTGLLLLTPEYAAPEQLRGETVTTSTDVYALGVLLYEVLVRHRPHLFAGKTASQIERVVSHQDPKRPSLAAIADHGVPAQNLPWTPTRLAGDLDTVVLKALSKEPQQRYGSVRELAQELERFLSGEPVVARPIGWFSRSLRKARRYPRTSAAAVSVATVLVVLAVVLLNSRRLAKEEALLAQRFGQEIELIEVVLQRAYLTPLHDIRPELEQVRKQMDRIETEMVRFSGTSRAIGEFALGRGYLGLGEEERARLHLERAWDASQSDAQIAYSLGLTLSRLYRDALEQLAQIRSAEVRAIRRREIEAKLREPARRALEAARGGSPHAEYVAASLDFFAGDPEQALSRLAAWENREPWFYEADLLAGDIHSESYRVAIKSGQTEVASVAFSEAEESYARAARVARSDPRAYDGLCALLASATREQHWGHWGTEVRLEDLRKAANESCHLVLAVNPDRSRAHLHLGHVEWLWANYRKDLGEDPRPNLEKARSYQQRAGELDPENAKVWVTLGATFRTEASFVSSRGEDPSRLFSQALAAYERAIQIDPTEHDAYSSLSVLEAYLGDFERRRGGEPEPHFEKAIAAGLRAVELLPGFTSGHVNLGVAYAQLAILRRDQGHEALASFEAGASALRTAIDINPEFYPAHYNLGELLLAQAELVLSNGQDPTRLIEEATGLLELAELAWPDYATTLFLQAQGEMVLARWDQSQGRDPIGALQRAREWADRGVTMLSATPDGFVSAARVHLIEADWQLSQQKDPLRAVGQAETLLGQALEGNPRLAEAHKRIAEAHWLRGRWLVVDSADPTAELEAGLRAIRQAAHENPKDAEVFLQEAQIQALWAQWLTARQQDPSPRIGASRLAAEKALLARSGFREAQELLDQL